MGFDGKPFRSITRGETDLSMIPVLEGSTAPSSEPVSAQVATLIAFMKQALEGQVVDVRASTRLYDSIACLVADSTGPDMRLRQILQAHGKLGDAGRSILEINPGHPLVSALASRLGGEHDKELLDDAAWLILDEARLMEGEPPADPALFAARLTRTMQRALG